uniref:High mobility group protein B2 n=1 Tax=Caligus clemensi TaxID=344056 RepID=C1C1E9_CALCM|nr:High mobility group protein B2 [Caligus clemensi]
MPKKAIPKGPEGPRSPFQFFTDTCLEEYRRRHPEEEDYLSRVRNKCQERWVLMSAEEKKRFIQMASEDKTRFKVEKDIVQIVELRRDMAGVKKLASGCSKKKREKPKKKQKKKQKASSEPGKPKRFKSCFFMFCSEHRKRVWTANPDFTPGDVSRELARMWAELSPEEKQVFVEKSNVDKERYQREKFVFENGVCESDSD